MKSLVGMAALVFTGVAICGAQSRPTMDCRFPDAGFAAVPDSPIRIAEVVPPSAATLVACGSPQGCAILRARRGTPVEIYEVQRDWTCGYFSSSDGAGPAWIRSSALRVLSYSPHPAANLWEGTWVGGEDRVRIRSAQPGTLRLSGGAQWHGRKDNIHFGDFNGEAAPQGNHLHFVENGPDSCTIDLTLLGRYILASDNQRCGGMNVRFQGIWKRIAVSRAP